MAKATVKQAAPMIVLELTGEEAAYVLEALLGVNPAPLDRFGEDYDDPVYTALCDALDAAGVDRFTATYSTRN